MRELTFMYRWPGLIEAVARKPDDPREEIGSEGYRDSGIYDLLIDLDPEDDQPYCFMSTNFDRNYPSVIWGLKARMTDELFDVPQAQLKAVPLHIAFSWAYYHFILEDGKLLPSPETVIRIDPNNFTQIVLAHALQTMAA
jgi:hypothetical protein